MSEGGGGGGGGAVRRVALLLLAFAGPAGAQEAGATSFGSVCGACHGAAGEGIAGIAPPLAGTDVWARLGDAAPTYLAGVMAAGLAGRITVDGADYVGLAMPSQGHLPAGQLAAIGTYVLVTLNGRAGGLDVGEVEAALADPPSHKALREVRRGAGS